LALSAWVAPAAAYQAAQRFLFMSSPTTKSVYYAPLPRVSEFAKPYSNRIVQQAKVLIEGDTSKCQVGCTNLTNQGLTQPTGLAVWHGKEDATLYVADTAQQRIFKYPIWGTVQFDTDDPSNYGSVQAGEQTTVLAFVPNVYGLALDGFGNLYYATTDGIVGWLSADTKDGKNFIPALGTNPTVPWNTILYTSSNQQSVAQPASLAADNFYVYWANQDNGQTAGTVVKALEKNVGKLAATYPDFPKAVAKNVAKAKGVCIARNNVFYTAEQRFLFAVKASGGSVVEVTNLFNGPRGCTYDGDNTLFVADVEDNVVYSLPANFPTLRAIKRIQRVATVGAPDQLAIFTSAETYFWKGASARCRMAALLFLFCGYAMLS
jgi:sugar lactone lactonase YvrE